MKKRVTLRVESHIGENSKKVKKNSKKNTKMGISRDSLHKRSHTGAKRAQIRKKRKFELGRQAANTKIGAKRIHVVRVRGGNLKYRALRLDTGM